MENPAIASKMGKPVIDGSGFVDLAAFPLMHPGWNDSDIKSIAELDRFVVLLTSDDNQPINVATCERQRLFKEVRISITYNDGFKKWMHGLAKE